MSDGLYVNTEYGRLERRYRQLHREIAELHASKNVDYGQQDRDPYANFRRAEDVGIEPWRGAVVRMLDKVARVETFCKRGELENESFKDSLLDLANYALITCALWLEQHSTEDSSVNVATRPEPVIPPSCLVAGCASSAKRLQDGLFSKYCREHAFWS